ncbi:tripartite tricarboxylate transporter TctB family protein [uncultured Tateyamaria sp.]|uniref:tripartite tricarboxylate transporter TctB family protein n=1 Tax=uncultured Tateyamaria sp. TaxID=455651 RepID=UPI00260D2427|nr:tripartite tricarboxylate transporter TctB family protein [uncultured Tateyamaria sp.]
MAPGSSPAPRLVGVALVLIGIGATATSMSISLDQYGRWGARFFPLAGSIALILLGLAELRNAPGTHTTERKHLPAIAALLMLSVAYVWVISGFGYLIATALAAPAALWIFGIRSAAGLGLAALLCPAAYHLVFFKLLGVFPPLGRYFDLLDVIGGY